MSFNLQIRALALNGTNWKNAGMKMQNCSIKFLAKLYLPILPNHKKSRIEGLSIYLVEILFFYDSF